MKKILFLGGSKQQVSVIIYAKSKGYQTILCDYLDDNPGIEVVDVFYLISTRDKEQILRVALENQIDGVIAYASDPAVMTAAYVSRKMNLKSNSISCVEILSNKNLFRQFLKNHNFSVPEVHYFNQNTKINKELIKEYPVMVKPTDLSGSKGVSKVERFENLQNAFEHAFHLSEKGEVVIEDFIEMDHPYMVGGDGFIVNGSLEYIGAINSHRGKQNIYVPIGNSYPLVLSEDRKVKIHDELQKALNGVGFMNGAINFEIMFDRFDRLYIIEIGARNGGNMIPEFLREISGFDMISSSVEILFKEFKMLTNHRQPSGFYINYVIHSDKKGLLKSIDVHKEYLKNVIFAIDYKQLGDEIEEFKGANKAIGIRFFEFDNQLEYEKALNIFESLVTVSIR